METRCEREEAASRKTLTTVDDCDDDEGGHSGGGDIDDITEQRRDHEAVQEQVRALLATVRKVLTDGKGRRIPKRRDAACKVPAPPPKPSANASDEARAEYMHKLVEEWWPDFLHHARMVIVWRHVHAHCFTCTSGVKGKTGGGPRRDR